MGEQGCGGVRGVGGAKVDTRVDIPPAVVVFLHFCCYSITVVL